MVILSDADKILVLACGFLVVAMAVLMVVCVVAPVCPMHRILPERLRINTITGKRRKKDHFTVESGKGDGVHDELTGLKCATGATYINYGNDVLAPGSDCCEPRGKSQQGGCDDSFDGKPSSNNGTPHHNNNMYGGATTGNNGNNNGLYHMQRRPTILSTRGSLVDSNYSSMTPTGSRPSTPVSSKSDPLDLSSSSLDTSSIRSADSSPLYGSVTISLQLSTTADPSTVRLLIGLQEAQDLPPRDTVACGDPFFRITVVKESRAFRRSKSKGDVLAEFETNVQRRTRHPIYNQKFAKELPRPDIKDCVIRFAAFDKDKYANPTAFGETAITLKNLNLSLQGQPIFFSLELSEPKQSNGELQMGVMYLPTAERLAFSAFRVANLRPENMAGDLDSYNAYIRIIMLRNGKMAAKKKTGAVKLSTAPNFDESIAFDVPTEQIRNLSFVVVVVAALKEQALPLPPGGGNGGNDVHDIFRNAPAPSPTHDSSSQSERCLGKARLGPNSPSTGLQHWELALQRPREQVMLWHALK